MWSYDPDFLGKVPALPPLPVSLDVPPHLQLLEHNSNTRSRPNNYSDVVFISTDFENLEGIRSHAYYTGLSKRTHAQVGVSILDTKSLSSIPPQEAIKTYNFMIGGSSSASRKLAGNSSSAKQSGFGYPK